jgi:hypothetical protein
MEHLGAPTVELFRIGYHIIGMVTESLGVTGKLLQRVVSIVTRATTQPITSSAIIMVFGYYWSV